MRVCAHCGKLATLDYVNMIDMCPHCKHSPFVEAENYEES